MLEKKEIADIREITYIMLNLDDAGRQTMLYSGRTLMTRQEIGRQMQEQQSNILKKKTSMGGSRISRRRCLRRLGRMAPGGK